MTNYYIDAINKKENKCLSSVHKIQKQSDLILKAMGLPEYELKRIYELDVIFAIGDYNICVLSVNEKYESLKYVFTIYSQFGKIPTKPEAIRQEKLDEIIIGIKKRGTNG